MAQAKSKAEKAREFIKKHPEKTGPEIAKRFDISDNYAYQLRSQALNGNGNGRAAGVAPPLGVTKESGGPRIPAIDLIPPGEEFTIRTDYPAAGYTMIKHGGKVIVIHESGPIDLGRIAAIFALLD